MEHAHNQYKEDYVSVLCEVCTSTEELSLRLEDYKYYATSISREEYIKSLINKICYSKDIFHSFES